jgi:MFS family permease
VSRAGDAFNTVGLVVLVFQLTGSGLGVAGTVALEILPVLLLGPLAGLVVDRYPRRTLLVGADLARGALAMLIALVSDSVAVAYGVAFGLAAFAQVFNPAASATLPDIVRPEELVEANAKLWTVAVVAQMVLAPLAGGLIAAYGTGPAFAVNALSYFGSAALLSGLRAGRSPAMMSRIGGRALLDGVAAVRAQSLLARLAVVQGLAALSAGATSGLLVVLAAEALGVGPAGFGWLLAAIGLGAAGGPLLLRHFIRPGDRRWLFGPYALRGGVDLMLATATSPLVAAPALVLYGVGTSTGMIAYQSTLQRAVEAEVRGRVFALYDVLWNAARLLSLGLGGLLADAVGVRAVYAVGGLLLLAAFGVGWRGDPALECTGDRRGAAG